MATSLHIHTLHTLTLEISVRACAQSDTMITLNYITSDSG